MTVPFAFPHHDELHDCYRYTECTRRHMPGTFRTVHAGKNGIRKMPHGYVVIAEE